MTEQEVLARVQGSYGILTEICQRCGCTRQELLELMEEHPEVLRAIEEERSHIRDVAEKKLLQLVAQGNEKMIAYVLDKMGGLWERAKVEKNEREDETDATD